jgi:hypothetical protein
MSHTERAKYLTDLTDEQWLDKYKQTSARTSSTWSEVLEVLQSFGYQKG